MQDQNWRHLMDDRKSKVNWQIHCDFRLLTQGPLRYKLLSDGYSCSNTTSKIAIGINMRSKQFF